MGTDQPAIANGDTLAAHYPEGIRWNIDIPRVGVGRLIDDAIATYADQPAIDFKGKTITYRDLNKLISRAAKGLQTMGVKPGDKVGLYMPNTPYYPVMFFAALKIGATVVNYSPLYKKDELRAQIQDSGTSVMVTLDLADYQENIRGLLDEGTLRKAVTCPMAGMLPWAKGWLFWAFKQGCRFPYHAENRNVHFSALADNDGWYRHTDIDPESLAVLQYTGGTTGVPKGAALTHFNLVANAYQIREFFCAGPGKPDAPGLMHAGKERVLAAIPYFHVFGMMISMIASLNMGAELDIIPNPRDIKDVMKTLHHKRPALFPAVPRLLQAIAENRNAHKYDLTGPRAVISGGAALAANVKKMFEAAVTPGVIKQGYGLSETSPVAASNPPYGINKPETVGLPYPRTEIKIADLDDPDRIMKIGEAGEICIRGPQVMQGYYGRPEETEKVIKDGWFLTGDIGYLDEDMYLHIVDRKKRMIKINGEQVFPSQMEEAINAHPAVAECVVISLPNERSGEVAKAFIRFKADADIPAETEMRAFLEGRLSRLAVPRLIEYRTDELPKTAVGKPDWKRMQDEERANLAAATAPAPEQPKIQP